MYASMAVGNNLPSQVAECTWRGQIPYGKLCGRPGRSTRSWFLAGIQRMGHQHRRAPGRPAPAHKRATGMPHGDL